MKQIIILQLLLVKSFCIKSFKFSNFNNFFLQKTQIGPRKNVKFSWLTLSWQAYKNDDFGRQGPFNGPSLKSVKMKLQRCARSQNRGSWVCPTHLDYSQMATMCISRVYTCPPWYQENWSQEIFTMILIVEGPAVV